MEWAVLKATVPTQCAVIVRSKVRLRLTRRDMSAIKGSRFLWDSSTKTLNLSLVHWSYGATAADPPAFGVYSPQEFRQQLLRILQA